MVYRDKKNNLQTDTGLRDRKKFIDRLVVYMNEKINRDLTFLEPVPLFGKASI